MNHRPLMYEWNEFLGQYVPMDFDAYCAENYALAWCYWGA